MATEQEALGTKGTNREGGRGADEEPPARCLAGEPPAPRLQSSHHAVPLQQSGFAGFGVKEEIVGRRHAFGRVQARRRRPASGIQ